MLIALKIKLGDIDKSRIFTSEKGNKYLDLILMDNRGGPDQYGNDGFSAHSVSKEERENGERGPIVGNWKYLVRPDAQPKSAAQPKHQPPPVNPPADDDIPF